LDVDKFAEEAFRRDGSIRYVGIVDIEHGLLLSKMREGIQSVSASEEDDRNFVQMMGFIIVRTAEKLQRVLGNLESMTVRYEKVLLVFLRVKKVLVVLSYNPDVTKPFMSASSDIMRMLGTTYLGEDD
jgi:hypothetical protein